MGFRDIIPFLQLFGTTTFDAVGQPTARTSTTVMGINTHSPAWSMAGAHMIAIELDATNRGGGVLDGTWVFQRAIIPVSFRFTLGGGVTWVNVPAAEMGLDLVAAENDQIQEFTFMSAGNYRIINTVHNVNGDLWAAMSARALS